MYNIVHTLCTQVYDFHRHMNMCFLVPWIGYHMLPARLEITWAEIHHSFGKPTGWILNVPTMSFAIGRYKPARIRQTCLKGCRGSKKKIPGDSDFTDEFPQADGNLPTCAETGGPVRGCVVNMEPRNGSVRICVQFGKGWKRIFQSHIFHKFPLCLVFKF
jgi:hypothetical protein